MSEAELFELYEITFDSSMLILQWWVSASIGVVGIAHFAANRLNVGLVTTLLLLYVFFSIWSANGFLVTAEIGVALLDSLRSLEDEGVALSPATIRLLEGTSEWSAVRSVVIGFSTFFCTFGGFLATISYVLYSYRITRENK